MIEIDDDFKKLIQFSIRRIIKSEMLDRRMGTWCEILNSFEFSDEEYKQVDELIKNEEFPCGYYKLCDLIGEKYV